MEHLLFMKDFVRKYNYPLIESMSEDQIPDIFHKSNRCFLVSWSLKVLNDEYQDAFERSDSDKEVLGSFVYELGFCTKKELLPFMSGELPADQQIEILNRMFRFIEDVRNTKKLDPEQRKTVSLNDLVQLKNTNLNLFPMFGNIKTLTPEERVKKIEQLTRKLAEHTSNTSEPTGEDQDKSAQETDISKCNKELVETFKTVKDNFKQIRNVTQTIMRERSFLAPDANYEINPEASEIIKKCSDYLGNILQFVKDVHTINDFQNNFSNVQELDHSIEKDELLDDVTSMMTVLAEQASHVSRIFYKSG